MRMAVDQFLALPVNDRGDIEGAQLLPDLGIEDDVQEDIAQLLPDLRKVPVDDRVRQFIGLFNGQVAQRFQRLFLVPGTLSAKLVHDGGQSFEGLGACGHSGFQSALVTGTRYCIPGTFLGAAC